MRLISSNLSTKLGTPLPAEPTLARKFFKSSKFEKVAAALNRQKSLHSATAQLRCLWWRESSRSVCQIRRKRFVQGPLPRPRAWVDWGLATSKPVQGAQSLKLRRAMRLDPCREGFLKNGVTFQTCPNHSMDDVYFAFF